MTSISNPAALLAPKVLLPGAGECIEAFGDCVHVLLRSEDTGGELVLMLDETPPGSGPPLHLHHHEEQLWIVQRGHYEFQIGDEITEVKSGAVIFGPRDVPHTFCEIGQEPGRLLTAFVPGGFDHFLKRCGQEFSTGAPDIQKIRGIGEQHGFLFLTPESALAQNEKNIGGALLPKIVQPDEGLVMEAHRNRIRFILTSEDTDGQFALIELQTPPGGGPRLHGHTREDELFIVQSGRYEFQIGEQLHQVGPGAVVYAPCGVAHSFCVTGEEPGKMFVLFRPGGFENFFVEMCQEFAAEVPDSQKLSQISAAYGLFSPSTI